MTFSNLFILKNIYFSLTNKILNFRIEPQQQPEEEEEPEVVDRHRNRRRRSGLNSFSLK